ncbi:MAG: ABC transporter substrate-binding protein, partial [Actinobacteria bacterium]
MRSRLAAIGVVLVVAAGAFVPVSRAGATTPPAKIDAKGILQYGLDLTVSGAGGTIALDPTEISGSPFNVTPARLIYDTLVRLDADGNPHPGLATAWKFPDDRTIELTLRTGVKFQDGTAFNAAAVKAGLERTLASGNPLLNKNFFELDSVEAVGDGTVRIHLKSPIVGAFFGLLSTKETFIPSPTAVKKEGSAFGQHPVGAGPYQLERFEPEQLIAVRKFKGFWQKRGWKLAGIDF